MKEYGRRQEAGLVLGECAQTEVVYPECVAMGLGIVQILVYDHEKNLFVAVMVLAHHLAGMSQVVVVLPAKFA